MAMMTMTDAAAAKCIHLAKNYYMIRPWLCG